MAKSIIELEKYSLEKIRKSLSENNACYVLITCNEPSKDGKMNVEMSYEGDEVLASYLVENAMQVFDNNTQTEKSH
jgi:hypothetical protein